MLYIVATPIGNLKDMSFRGVETLKKVDYILCEDTRTSLPLLNEYEIKKPLYSYHKFNENEKCDKIICDLKEGKEIALISDAGTPAISDPGNILINACIENQIEYTCVSGTCALINAFVLSGFNSPFTYIGFLPTKTKEVKELLKNVKDYNTSLIFYVSVHDLEKNISTLYSELGDRKYCLVREITKKFEEINFGQLKDGYNGTKKGEFVLIVDKPNCDEKNEISIEEELFSLIKNGVEKNDAIKQVAKNRNIKKNDVYKLTIK